MARKNYSEEFRRQAVDLYESTPGATLNGIAADLGIVRGTLRHWVDRYGTGRTVVCHEEGFCRNFGDFGDLFGGPVGVNRAAGWVGSRRG